MARTTGQMTIEEQVRETIMLIAGVSYEDTARHMDFVGDLGMDSLESVELQLELESQFGISEVPEDVAIEIKTVGQAVDYIVRAKGLATLEGGDNGN